jgi:hypothetical protein
MLEPERTLDHDPQKRPVRALLFRDPCGHEKGRVAVYVTAGPHFSLENFFSNGKAMNIWHYEINGDRITISPSIGLHAVEGHTEACHLIITNQPFKVVD